MEKKYCFAYNGIKNKCMALTDCYCEKEGKCKFYKTSKQWLDEQLKSEKHMDEIGFVNPYK